MKRLLAFILTAAVCLCGYATPGFAIEPETTIQLAALEITAPFDPDKVDVIRTYDAPANKVTAKVLDKISGEVLDEYSERPEIPFLSSRIVLPTYALTQRLPHTMTTTTLP